MRKASASLAVLVLLVLVAVQLASGGTGQATIWNVAVGEQGRPPAGTPKGTTLNQFFPGKLTINAGDRVAFTSFGFHTVSYLAGKTPAPPLGPAQGATYEGIIDSTGQPFYFDGLQAFGYTASVFAPAGPKSISGKTLANSGGIAAAGPKKPAKVEYTFPKPGAFKILCQIHPGMQMTVQVKPKGASVPSTDEVAARIKAETDAAWAKAKPLGSAKAPAGTVTMGVGARTTILDFLPAVSRVKAGSTVTFVNRAPSEVHNVAFGPLKYLDTFMKQTDLFPFGPNAKNQVTPVFVYGSDPKGTPLTKGIHGNGFYATPLADGAPGGLPNSVKVTFSDPGRYHFICLLHGPDMAADIVVTR